MGYRGHGQRIHSWYCITNRIGLGMAKQKTAKKEIDVSLIETARIGVAERYDNPTLKRAILSGDWDRGSLVRNEADRIASMCPEQDDTEEE